RGVLVKTIGDAVMAAFASERDAIEASVEMQQALPGFRAQNPEADFAFLKVGVFAGPCYMVTANDTLDYFGQSVNVAARLQATAGPGEVVLPSELATQAEAQGWLGGANVSGHFVPELKGIAEKLSLARVVLDPPSSSPRALA
ncbi:MAG TPA: adenylate/guanylate cyclase domain-containing protein, partial [Polyangiaceae bacterium]